MVSILNRRFLSLKMKHTKQTKLTKQIYKTGDANKTNKTTKVDCYKCIHFSITWESQAPKACTLFGFKSTGLPSRIVLNSTGMECMGFEEKKTAKK